MAGLAVLIVTLGVSFAPALWQVPHWGATPAEVVLTLPGDELAPRPLLNWTNAIAINAPPADVWPWVAQLGDTRGGFYSYTFFEDRIGSLTGAADYAVDYENADRLHPEWQNPRPGDGLIQGTLKVREVVPGQYLLAEQVNAEAFTWIWLWRLCPADEGGTRLVVRFRIQLPEATDNPVVTAVMTAGGFVMQQRMLSGLKVRAGGGVEPPFIEALEIGLWLALLAIGLVAAGLYLFQREWQRPLALAVLAVATLIALTFIQPAIWMRVVVNLLLLGRLWWAARPSLTPRALPATRIATLPAP
jgi:hypothetical protein